MDSGCDNRRQIDLFRSFAEHEQGIFYENFSLYYLRECYPIDLLFFIPSRGILFGEKLSWSAQSLDGVRVERPTARNKKHSATRLESTASAIRNKLEEVLSFDSTVCERFFWLSCLSEEEFDLLDDSFHALLDKERLIFSDSTEEEIFRKLQMLAPKLQEEYSALKIMGTLQSHQLILPTHADPFGRFLSEEQLQFLRTDYFDTVTALFGEYNSGKSTALIRKALQLLLSDPHAKIVIFTPTILGGEILHKELISLLEYGALEVDLTSLSFCTPKNMHHSIGEDEKFQSASIILCDDAHRMEREFINTLIEHRQTRWLLLSFHNEYLPLSDSTVFFHNNYQNNIPFVKLPASDENVLLTLLVDLRQQIRSTTSDTIMVILENDEKMIDFKEAIDEYFHLNTRLLSAEFSLQYQNLDDLILTTPENTYGVHVPHVYLITSNGSEQYYPLALSRASETATIISFSNSNKADTNNG